MSRWLLASIAAVMTVGCSSATPEQLCEKADEAERAACTKGLTEIKEKLDAKDKGLWKDFCDCAKQADFKDKRSVKGCIPPDLR